MSTLESKVAFLNNLGTKDLFTKIQDQENQLEQLLLQDAKFRSDNSRYLASYGEDCAEVKAILAELTLDPPLGPDGKRPTVTAIGSWLTTQRVKNPQLAEAIQKQENITFSVETGRIHIDVAKKRLESLKGLLALRTAQIEFLVS